MSDFDFLIELREVLVNVQAELSATGRYSQRIQNCIDGLSSRCMDGPRNSPRQASFNAPLYAYAATLGAVPAANPAPQAGSLRQVPDGLLDRVKAAEERINADQCIRRIPADPTDPDLVMCEVRMWLEGRGSPLWIKGNERKFSGVGELERSGYIPEGSAAEREATPAQAGADDGRLNDPAPPHKLPEWHECKNVIDDYEFHLSVLAGNEGQQLATIDPAPRAPTELERFIHEYDDASVYRSGWFMHRLEKLLDWHANEIRAQAGAIAWESTTVGYIKYITDERYQKFIPEIRKWYKPYRCTNCAQAGAELPCLPAHEGSYLHKSGRIVPAYTADQMRAYALLALGRSP